MDEIMKQLNQMINQLGYKTLIIAVGVIVILIVVYLIYRALRLKKYRKLIVEYENAMNATKSLPLQYRLGRVHSISKNMPDVLELYEEYAKEFERITDFQKNELAVLINDVDEQLFYGKLRKVSKKMNELHSMLNKYEKESQSLLSKIEKITEIENIQRIEIIKVKEKYRKTIDNFESIRFSVEEFIPDLLEIFNNIDDSFVQLENLMNNQKFEEAKEFTQDIDKRIIWLDDHLDVLPQYIAVVRQYIPKKQDRIQDLVETMSEDQYSLNQLSVFERQESIQEQLDTSVQCIKKLQLDDVPEQLETLVKDIDELIKDLEDEKTAFDAFKEKWEECYSLITHIYNQYKELLIDYNKIKSLYKIDEENIVIEEKYQIFDALLKDSYDLENEMKNGNFSYMNMIQKVEELKQNASIHQEYIDDFIVTRDHLYIQEQRAINELENINIVLLEIKSEIKNKHLPMINESYKDYIQDSYDKAAQIQAYRQNRPVELSELSKKVDSARDVIYKLYDNVHNLVVTAEMVEEAIVFGNRYRSTFLEVNTELTKAEVLFRNGEYTKALSTAVDIIEKIQPGSYEELIKKSAKKS